MRAPFLAMPMRASFPVSSMRAPFPAAPLQAPLLAPPMGGGFPPAPHGLSSLRARRQGMHARSSALVAPSSASDTADMTTMEANIES